MASDRHNKLGSCAIHFQMHSLEQRCRRTWSGRKLWICNRIDVYLLLLLVVCLCAHMCVSLCFLLRLVLCILKIAVRYIPLGMLLSAEYLLCLFCHLHTWLRYLDIHTLVVSLLCMLCVGSSICSIFRLMLRSSLRTALSGEAGASE
jgi:hypothetical protein